ncbi:hypothetical protein BSCA_2517, partial [Bifidobacterium scardovii]
MSRSPGSFEDTTSCSDVSSNDCAGTLPVDGAYCCSGVTAGAAWAAGWAGAAYVGAAGCAGTAGAAGCA